MKPSSPVAPRFLAVDFFCGAGGTTRGLIDAGGYVLAGVDKEAACEQTYVKNNSNKAGDGAAVRYLRRDIFPLTPEYPSGEQHQLVVELDEIISCARAQFPGIPLLFAICAPCQPFTTLSKKEMKPERLAKRGRDRNLLSEAAEFVKRFRPELVLSENVSGIKDPRYGGIWEDFQVSLKSLGYATGSRVVCTSNFGVPQFRKRSILLAAKRELVDPAFFADLLADELATPDRDPRAKVTTVQEAIGHLPALKAGETHPDIPNHRARSLSDLNKKRLSVAMPGQSNACLDNTQFGDLALPCHKRVNQRLKTRCFTDVYTRMSPDRPSPTITTRCHSISNGRFGHYDPSQLRGISLREAATLQSFPSDYIFFPTTMIEPVAKMIGNAVPPKLAEYCATYLLTTISSERL